MPPTEESQLDKEDLGEVDDTIDPKHLIWARVKRGCLYLDITAPAWRERMMSIPTDHPALVTTLWGNVVGTYDDWTAMAEEHSRNWMIYRGFAPDWNGEYGPAYSDAALSDAWRTAIDTHRASTPVGGPR